MKHTPGPWNINRLSSCTAVETESGSRITHLWDHVEHECAPCGSIESQDKTQEEIEANCRLIASSPELLEACKELFDYLNEHLPEQEYYINILQKAISKAEGESWDK